ncbi:MAG: ATP-binding protein [Anaerolineae bacterium]|nr:ATP-binding protein [Anaerolineae bacterium]
MDFEILRNLGDFHLEPATGMSSWLLLILYSGLFLAVLWRGRHSLQKLNRKQWLVFIFVLLMVFPANMFLILYRRGVGVPPASRAGVGVLPYIPNVSLSAFALVAGIAYWLGPAPALLVSLWTGITGAWFSPIILTDVMAYSAWGGLAALCFHQRYKGELFHLLRLPIVALSCAALGTVLGLSLSHLIANQLRGSLSVANYIFSLWINEMPLWWFSSAIIAAVMHLLLLIPGLRISSTADVSSFYSKSLRAQFIIMTSALVLVSVTGSVLAASMRAVGLAQEQAILEMERSAISAANGLRQFYATGKSLILSFANDAQIKSSSLRDLTPTLINDLNVVPFFDQLLFVSETGEVISSASLLDGDDVLTPEETAVLEVLIRHNVSVDYTEVSLLPFNHTTDIYGLSFLSAVSPEDGSGANRSYLIGRIEHSIHPEIENAISTLQQTREVGSGFIIDDRNVIVVHPDATMLHKVWQIDEDVGQFAVSDPDDLAYASVNSAGNHVLVLVHLVDGLRHRVVLQLPYVVVLESAAKISMPLLAVEIAFGSVLILMIFLSSTRITRPLNSLAQAADTIAKGDLSVRVEVTGDDDEVARLGNAFEGMRVRLQDRLHDLSLLLKTAQKVSATLDLEDGIAPILNSAVEETGACVARFVLLEGEDKIRQVFSLGDNDSVGNYTSLERVLIRAMRRQKEPLVAQDLDMAKGVPQLPESIKSLAAFPVNHQNKIVAILWIGAGSTNAFDEDRINFLTTLVSQAGILTDNVRLFQTAEGGRQRLAAILSSTTDAILVTDADTRLVLINPAAQKLLSLDGTAYGKPLHNLGLPESLAEALNQQAITARRVRRYQIALPETVRDAAAYSSDEHNIPAVEIPLEDGRTFYASIAPIRDRDGVISGVVVVMRDVTHFKELDEMKSEFVATVSHDLRAPLTSMRGYATMLNMVGEVTDKQREYIQKILYGIEQMNTLIGDLLNLRRVEAGVGIRQDPCRLGLVMVEAVDAMRSRATAKNINLQLLPTEGAPTVLGDRTLLRQAVSNLVDNAIKYTPTGGEVLVSLENKEHEVVVRVSDNGIGIAPGDQVRLFEKFYRIKRRETGNVKGTGLGLALVKSIVERHGGRVGVESTINEGSTFFLELPLPKDEDLNL